MDDSFPKFFDPAAAAARVREKGDILYTEGGFLVIPGGVKRLSTRFKPDGFENYHSLEETITSCVFSALLSQYNENLPPLIGEISVEDCLQHFKILQKHHIKAAHPTFGNTAVDAKHINQFRRRFGNL